MKPEVDPTLFGGCTVLRTDARSLARPSSPSRAVTLVPYYLWANRGRSEMSVWLSTREYAPGDTGPAGGLIFYVNPNVEADGWRYLEAAPYDQSAGAKWGCFRRAITGARGTAIGTGKQNTADMVAACNEPGSAAHLCANLTLNGVTGWFLPSRDELAAMYRALRATGAADFRDAGLSDNFSYWTSSQQTTDMANHIDFADAGRQHYDDKDFPRPRAGRSRVLTRSDAFNGFRFAACIYFLVPQRRKLMRKAMLSLVAATFAMTGGLLAMTPQSQPDPKQTVTITGCVQNENDVLKSSMPKTGMTDEFVLTHSMIRTGTSAAQPAPTQPAPSATAENKIYRVTGDQEASLKAQLGHKVEITGTFKSESDARTELGAIGTSGKPPATPAEPTAMNTPEITISAIKPIADSCTAK